GVARGRGERDHRAVHVGERVEHLKGGQRVGARTARGRDRAGDVVAVFRGRRHHRARGIVDRGGRLALRPVDRAVGGGVAGGGARPFPEAHCRTSKAKAPPSGPQWDASSSKAPRGGATGRFHSGDYAAFQTSNKEAKFQKISKSKGG